MILRVIILALLVLLVIRAVRLLVSGMVEGSSPTDRRRVPRGVKLVRDPVCGTHVPEGTALSLTARGATHYFCSEECRSKWKAER